jgi:CRP-like cAMP-binding protein
MADDMSMLRSALQKVDFFYSLNFSELDMLIKSLKKRKVKQGEAIIRQGEIGDKFYLIGRGAFSIHVKKGMSGTHKVADLSDGDFFGEMALVTDLPRTATVVAEEEGELFILYKKDFKKILLSNQRISAIITEVLAKRRASNK